MSEDPSRYPPPSRPDTSMADAERAADRLFVFVFLPCIVVVATILWWFE